MKNFVMVVYGTFLWFTTLISTTHTSAGKTPPFTFRGFTSKRNRHFSILNRTELQTIPCSWNIIFFEVLEWILHVFFIQCFEFIRSKEREKISHIFSKSTGWIINFCVRMTISEILCVWIGKLKMLAPLYN